jgi:hypothetical protein
MDSLLHPGLPVLCGFVAGFLVARLMPAKHRDTLAAMPDDSISDAQIEAEVRAGHRIEAIRLYRRRHACGLRPAEQAIKAIAQRIA